LESGGVWHNKLSLPHTAKNKLLFYNRFMKLKAKKSPHEFLKQGLQTKIEENIKNIEKQIPGEGLDYIANALDWVLSNLKREQSRKVKDKVFRKRTASEIVEDGYVTGCTDTALVFIALVRAKGIPTKYVEAVNKKWLEDKDKEGKGIRGHVFAECFVSGKWYQIDPARGVIHAKPNYTKFEIFAKGLDSWDLGIKDFKSLKEKFTNFRKAKT
jgi:hypothetical protein